MKIVAVIPARGGSKGVPGKNKKLLGGLPLISHTLNVALQCKNIARVVVSSDDDDIIDIALAAGATVIKRPPGLASDSTPTIDVIVHALNEIQQRFDAVCLLQPTTPFRSLAFLQECLHRFASEEFDSLISVRKVPHEYNPHWVFEQRDGQLRIATGEESIIARRQELPDAYHRDGSVYITKTDVILNQHSLYGKRIGFCESAGEPHVNIDTPEDWEKAEAMLGKGL